jgi:putative membrane protein
MAVVPNPALDNLRLAYENTTLAWMRTSLALIGFGFTIDKFFEGLPGHATATFFLNPRSIGITMIAFGLLSLVLSLYELRQFRKTYPEVQRSTAGYVTAMIAVLGIMAIVAAIFS